MFGKNPIAPKRDAFNTFLVKDIFFTIQGEGPYSGLPAVFVRLGGCNLRCHFCDTDFTSDLVEMTADMISFAIAEAGPACNLVVITGGEPMLQNLPLLISKLDEQDQTDIVQIETAGTVWPNNMSHFLDERRHIDTCIVVSPKTPKVNAEIYRHARAWKYIVSASAESLEGIPLGCARPPDDPSDTLDGYEIYLQPMDEQDPVKNKMNQDLCRDNVMKYDYRLSLQLHKIISVA